MRDWKPSPTPLGAARDQGSVSGPGSWVLVLVGFWGAGWGMDGPGIGGTSGPSPACPSAQNPAGCGSSELSRSALLPPVGPPLRQLACAGPLGRRGARCFAAAEGRTVAPPVPSLPPPELTSALHQKRREHAPSPSVLENGLPPPASPLLESALLLHPRQSEGTHAGERAAVPEGWSPGPAAPAHRLLTVTQVGSPRADSPGLGPALLVRVGAPGTLLRAHCVLLASAQFTLRPTELGAGT